MRPRAALGRARVRSCGAALPVGGASMAKKAAALPVKGATLPVGGPSMAKKAAALPVKGAALALGPAALHQKGACVRVGGATSARKGARVAEKAAALRLRGPALRLFDGRDGEKSGIVAGERGNVGARRGSVAPKRGNGAGWRGNAGSRPAPGGWRKQVPRLWLGMTGRATRWFVATPVAPTDEACRGSSRALTSLRLLEAGAPAGRSAATEGPCGHICVGARAPRTGERVAPGG